jgi:anthranilate synthase component 1
MSVSQSLTRDLNEENPMKVLAILLAQNPKRSVGFFQKSSESGGVFQPEETTIGFDPAEHYTLKGGQDPFQILKEQSSLAMGYLAYDSVRFREPILNRAKGGFSQIQADSTSAEFSIFQKILIFDHRKKKIKLITQEGKNLASEFDALLEASNRLSERVPTPASNAELKPEDFRCLLGSEAYKSGVRKLQQHILAGDIFQAVLSERFETTLTVTPFEIFQTLVEIGSSAYQFFFSTPERTVLGASPELLLSVKEGKLETHPIAGTRPRGKTEAEELQNQNDLLKDTKENAEHLMLVDLARNDLGRISKPGSVKVSERNLVKKFPSVMHIVSKVVGDLKTENTPVDALASCFPAGTLSGAPKIRAMQLISEIEGSPRGFYGGAFFLAKEDDLEACISIRSMEIIGDKGFIQAGAGIVMDSNPDSEYEEVLHKSRTLRRVLALTRLRRQGK